VGARGRKEYCFVASENYEVLAIIKWVLEQQDVRMKTEFIWLRIGKSSELLRNGNETSFSIKC
jgi:hypothetical protein